MGREGKYFSNNVAQQSLPTLAWLQLRRSFSNML